MDESLLKEAQDKNYVIFACGCGSRLKWRDHEGKTEPHSWLVTHDAHNNDNPDIFVYHPIMGGMRLAPTAITKAIMFFNNIAFSGRTALFMVMHPGKETWDGYKDGVKAGEDMEETLARQATLYDYTGYKPVPKVIHPPMSYTILEKEKP